MSYRFYKENKNPKQNYSNDIQIYNKILEIISNNFDTNRGLKLLVEYVDKLSRVYLTNEMATQILEELNKINNLFNILDRNLLEIDLETLKYIEQREELRKQKQFEKTDYMREQVQKTFIFEDNNTGITLIKKLE